MRRCTDRRNKLRPYIDVYPIPVGWVEPFDRAQDKLCDTHRSSSEAVSTNY
jgi:hypothetical protein